MMTRSFLGRWLVIGVSCSVKEGRVWRIKFEVLPPDPQMMTALLEYRIQC